MPRWRVICESSFVQRKAIRAKLGALGIPQKTLSQSRKGRGFDFSSPSFMSHCAPCSRQNHVRTLKSSIQVPYASVHSTVGDSLETAPALEVPASRAAKTMSINRHTAQRIYHVIRRCLAKECELESPFGGEVECDESYFGGRRGQSGWAGSGGFAPTLDALELRARRPADEVPLRVWLVANNSKSGEEQECKDDYVFTMMHIN